MALYDNETLYRTLKELQIIADAELEKAHEECKLQNTQLGEILISKELISDENLAKTVGDMLSIPYINLAEVSIPEEVLQIIPEVMAKKQHVIAFKKDSSGLHIAMADPSNLQTAGFIEKKAGIPVVVYISTVREINSVIPRYTKNFESTFDAIIAESIANAKHATHTDPPIIKIVETIIEYAYENRSSDIHIEPERHQSLVRFRIDGVLHDILKLPLELHPQVVTRIKVMAKLRTDEHLIPQDGKVEMKLDEEQIDIRVSVVPITMGENVVMRLLSEKSRQFSLNTLGFSGQNLQKVSESYEKPYGMILSTGPTGSGKTTTMYAILKILNKRDVNIMTIEDPVEYSLEGVNQIQVNSKTELTFASGLRSILRQDPNIILVGEIRDEETAGIAVNASMTGHLVLSTLHTNDAATAIPRLLDMKIEPFLIASTVNSIIGQRLVRTIHIPCRVSEDIQITDIPQYTAMPFIRKLFGDEKIIRLYRGKGCGLCHGTGYEGRIGIYEVLTLNETIRDAIIARKDADAIRNIAIQAGMQTMIEDGMEKVKQGITTVEEILRVTKE